LFFFVVFLVDQSSINLCWSFADAMLLV